MNRCGGMLRKLSWWMACDRIAWIPAKGAPGPGTTAFRLAGTAAMHLQHLLTHTEAIPHQ